MEAGVWREKKSFLHSRKLATFGATLSASGEVEDVLVVADSFHTLLTLALDGKLHKASEEYLAVNNIERATVLGGVNAVSESAEINLKALGIVCEERLAGSNRYDTCLDVLGRYRDVLNGEVMTVATGLDYPDALTGGVYAALNRSPLMLVGKSLTENQIAYLKSRGGDKLTVIGGEAYAVSQSVVEAVCRAMKEAQQTEN